MEDGSSHATGPEGDPVARLAEASCRGDLDEVSALLRGRPALARMGMDNHQPLHFAVLRRDPELVRLLMEHGADAREGVYPHREATSPLTIAAERGYTEIVAIIREQEARRLTAIGAREGGPGPDGLFEAIRRGDDEQAIARVTREPGLIGSRDPRGLTPLHVAAGRLRGRLVDWLLRHGGDPRAVGGAGLTPLDLAAGEWSDRQRAARFRPIAAALFAHGAELTPRSAVALGDADWILAWHDREARLPAAHPVEPAGGLLRIAVTHDRPEMVGLLLSLGCDPDERHRIAGGDQAPWSWGGPLWQCAHLGRHDMAERLLGAGADAGGQVYASGTPLHQALAMGDRTMVALLRGHGGIVDPTIAALYRQTDLARQMLAGEGVGSPVAEEMLGAAACGGDPDIVRAALDRVAWARGDPRWFGVLEQPLRIWSHGHPDWPEQGRDRDTYPACLAILLERADPNVRGRQQDRGRFGLTLLHSVAGAREHVTAEERLAFATQLLAAGARLDLRDNLLLSTPLGWACRWGRTELVDLFLAWGADPREPDAAPWASPTAWARQMGHRHLLPLLEAHGF